MLGKGAESVSSEKTGHLITGGIFAQPNVRTPIRESECNHGEPKLGRGGVRCVVTVETLSRVAVCRVRLTCERSSRSAPEDPGDF